MQAAKAGAAALVAVLAGIAPVGCHWIVPYDPAGAAGSSVSDGSAPADLGTVEAAADDLAPRVDMLASVGARGIIATTFGHAGRFVVAGDGARDDLGAQALLVDPSDRVVFTGALSYDDEPVDGWGRWGDVTVGRLEQTGAVDPTFAGDGVLVLVGPRYQHAFDLWRDPTGGNLLVAGATDANSDQPTLWRLTDAGELDPSFGSNGLAIVSRPGQTIIKGMAVDPSDGGYLLVGGTWASSAATGRMDVVRFTANGSRDASFGTNGVFQFSEAPAALAEAVIVTEAGQVLVAGRTGLDDAMDMTLWRLTRAGSLDTGFDGDGMVTSGSAGPDAAYHLLRSPDGAVAVGCSTGVDEDMTLWKLTSGGEIVSAAEVSNLAGADCGREATFDHQGRLLITGYVSATDRGDRDMAVWRLASLEPPLVDDSFAIGGLLRDHDAAGGNGDDLGYGIAVGRGGRIFVGGASRAPAKMTLAIWAID